MSNHPPLSSTHQANPPTHISSIKIRITNPKTNICTSYGIPRSGLETSALLRPLLHQPYIHIYWSGRPLYFALYRAWQTSGRVQIHTVAEMNKKAGETQKDRYEDLLWCWALRKVLDDALFQDMVISYIISRLKKWTTGTPPFVYALGGDIQDRNRGLPAVEVDRRCGGVVCTNVRIRALWREKAYPG